MVVELRGDACPLLFGKWKPDKFTEFYEDDPCRINLHYDFPFARVQIQSDNIYYPVHFVKGGSPMPSEDIDWGKLFDGRLVEMYHDAKKYLKKRLEQASFALPELKLIDVEKYSLFQRGVGFRIAVDLDKVKGGFENDKGRNRICSELYGSLEEGLREEFGVTNQKIDDSYFMGLFRIGHSKLTDYTNGIYTICNGPTGKVDAGEIHFHVMSNENGKMHDHRDVYEYCKNFIRDNDAMLKKYGKSPNAVFVGVTGNGGYWKIDLSHVELSTKLPQSVFSPKLLIENK